MADGQGNDWSAYLSAVWEVIQYVLGIAATAALAVGTWVVGGYRGHRAMTRRHEKWIETEDTRRGKHEAFVEEIKKAPYGDGLMEVIDELKLSDRKQLRLIARRSRENHKSREDFREMKTHLEYIRAAIDKLNTK